MKYRKEKKYKLIHKLKVTEKFLLKNKKVMEKKLKIIVKEEKLRE